MADDKKNIPEVDTPSETITPTVEVPAVTEPVIPEPALTDQEAVTLEHEGLAALFEMGEAVPDPGEQPIPIEPMEPVLPEQPKVEMEKKPPSPDKNDPAQEHSGKVVDFAAARNEAEKTPKEKPGKQKTSKKGKAEKPGKSRPPKEGKDKQPSKPRDKKSQSKPTPEQPTPVKEETPVVTEMPAEPAAPRDASRGEKEEIVYLDLSNLHPFKNHPFGVRDDAEMQGLVESVKASGVNQPALVRPREDGGYEIMMRQFYAMPLPVVAVLMLALLLLWTALCQHFKGRIRTFSNVVLACAATLIILYATLLSRTPGTYAVVLTPFAALAAARQQPELYREMLMNVFLFFPLGLTLSNALPRT